MPAAIAVRLLLGGLAVAAIAAGALGLRADHRCTTAKAAFAGARGAAIGPAAAQAADRCGDPRDRARIDVQLLTRGRRADAAALAQRMVRENPQDWVGWVAVYRLTGDRAALARAQALNPRGAPRR